MIPTKEETDQWIRRRLFDSEVLSTGQHEVVYKLLTEYNKWYAAKVIDRCSEVAETVMYDYDDEVIMAPTADLSLEEHDYGLIIDKQSILNIKKEL